MSQGLFQHLYSCLWQTIPVLRTYRHKFPAAGRVVSCDSLPVPLFWRLLSSQHNPSWNQLNPTIRDYLARSSHPSHKFSMSEKKALGTVSTSCQQTDSFGRSTDIHKNPTFHSRPGVYHTLHFIRACKIQGNKSPGSTDHQTLWSDLCHLLTTQFLLVLDALWTILADLFSEISPPVYPDTSPATCQSLSHTLVLSTKLTTVRPLHIQVGSSRLGHEDRQSWDTKVSRQTILSQPPPGDYDHPISLWHQTFQLLIMKSCSSVHHGRHQE